MLSYGATDASYLKYIKPFVDGKLEYPQIINVIEPSYHLVESMLLELHRVCDAKDVAMELDIKWRLERLFFVLYRDVFRRKELPKEQKQDAINNIRLVIDYIQENYQRLLTIQELAGLLHLSEPYFMRFFKKHTGMTCVDYMNDYRMERAVELLQTTNLSIMEISMQVGMHNISYFNRLFKKKYQMTPKEYRKGTEN
jgi:AraC-like DNA-binding protein